MSSCFLVNCFCVKSLQGWDKDKFSGLNSSDERHLRLLTDAVLELWLHVFALAACLLLVQQCCKCFHVMFVLLCPLVFWLIVFVWRVCKDETKINSAGWIPVTRDISAYLLMQSWNCFCMFLFLQLVCSSGSNVLQVLPCHVCPLGFQLIIFVWRVCKDIPVTRDISACLLMQSWNCFCMFLL